MAYLLVSLLLLSGLFQSIWSLRPNIGSHVSLRSPKVEVDSWPSFPKDNNRALLAPRQESGVASLSNQRLASSRSKGEELEETKSRYGRDVRNTFAWVGAAALFSIGVAWQMGTQNAIEFCSGYILEYCLSVDNLFVFLVLFDYFNVKDNSMKEKVLSYGILGAILLRGLFIGLGAVALEQSEKILLLFAGVLAFSSFKIVFSGDDEEDEEDEDLSDNFIVKLTKSLVSTSTSFDGDNFFTMENGVKAATPLLLCLICVELSDVVFAFDSVPAVFGVTQDPFVVFTSNIFAIAGLRSLFGVLSQAVADLKYLEKAVGLVLAVISAKLGAQAFDIELLSPLQSLVVVLSILGGGIALSLADPLAKKENT